MIYVILAWTVYKTDLGYDVIVAIESSADYMKAYKKAFDDFPSKDDISTTARIGQRVPTSKALDYFPDLKGRGYIAE
ncbi:hypothetical protein [Neolewinella xylanilytica]|uniref:hypothetical protein n=1 Tax=Neolewinella xylanilytica TaxID=1514080 RepID=UPI000CEB08E7|nr:hypothetical protein [Neolewinella xylanilytica]